MTIKISSIDEIIKTRWGRTEKSLDITAANNRLVIGNEKGIKNLRGILRRNLPEGSCQTIILKGNCGEDFGYYNSGTLIIEGNCGDYLGKYNSGTIIVEGNAGHRCSGGNKGTIFIKGNAKNAAGGGNKGTVIIKGNVKEGAAQVNKGLVIIAGNAGEGAADCQHKEGTLIVLGTIKSLSTRTVASKGIGGITDGGTVYATAVEEDYDLPWKKLTKKQIERIRALIK